VLCPVTEMCGKRAEREGQGERVMERVRDRVCLESPCLHPHSKVRKMLTGLARAGLDRVRDGWRKTIRSQEKMGLNGEGTDV
jgi:hypothetical protein